MKIFLQNNWLILLTIAMLAGILISSLSALFVLPFAYYQLTNWAVMGSSLIVAWQSYKKATTWIMWLFIIIAVIFNPLAPIYLSAFVWQIADSIVILLLIASFFFMKKKN